MAFEIYDKTDSVDLTVVGAKPPSSPTLIADFPRLSDNIYPSYDISLSPSYRLAEIFRPIGAIINSCIASPLPACLPPFTIFIKGTGAS